MFIIRLFLYAIIGLSSAMVLTGVLAYVYYVFFRNPNVHGHILWLEDTLRRLLTSYYTLIYFAIFLVITVTIILLLTRRTIKRLTAIQDAVMQMKNEDYRVLLPNDLNDSLGIIEKDLNALAYQVKDILDEHIGVQQAKDDFITNIAHDLRTPLTSIIGYLDLLSHKQIDRDISTKYATIAYEKSIQLENIVEVLLDIATYTIDNVRIHKQEVDLIKLFAQKQDEMYPQLQDTEMEIRIDISNPISTIQVDGELIARVMDNLITNAIRYAKDGKYIDILAEEQDDYIYISVITHSNSIPFAELERIFEKFYRLEKSRSLASGGIGLGLSISRRIIELHGGTLIARQTANGTAFDICLPNK